VNSSVELYEALKKLHLLDDLRDEFWWPESGTFEVVVGAILTQQTKWQKVEKSLKNLKEAGVLELEKLACHDIKELQTLIKPSGFYNTKAKYLKAICNSIMTEFGSFETFKDEVTKEWLLAQKGVGQETADSILCYGCYRDVMVVDSYTDRILRAFGYEFESYHDIQEWLVSGFEDRDSKFFALYHGMIVEFAKKYVKGKRVDVEVLKEVPNMI